MLKNRPTHQILQISVRQYCPVASVTGVTAYSYRFSLSKNDWICFWQLWHAQEYTHPWDIRNVSQALPICGRGGKTILLLLFFQKWLNMLLASLACSRIHPLLRHKKCRSGIIDLWQGWQNNSITSLFQKWLNMLLAALACSRIHPSLRHHKCQAGSTVLWHLWERWQCIPIASLFPKMIEYASGSSGMLENTSTPETQEMSVRQYCPVVSWHKWQHHSIASLFQKIFNMLLAGLAFLRIH